MIEQQVRRVYSKLFTIQTEREAEGGGRKFLSWTMKQRQSKCVCNLFKSLVLKAVKLGELLGKDAENLSMAR